MRVVCFLNQDDSFRIETFPLSKTGIARFLAKLEKDDAVAVEARPKHLLLLRPNQNLSRPDCPG